MAMGGGKQLSDVTIGSRAEVLQVRGPAAPRLFDLGVLPGTAVEVVLRAPLGDPIVLAVRGTQLGVRLRDAAGILVRIVP
ncbi:MAG TPA: ferrous iron transport protein A [Clostridiales bacterium]|nr:ferrous iron transport protein A [Clostridiales bacterium]